MPKQTQTIRPPGNRSIRQTAGITSPSLQPRELQPAEWKHRRPGQTTSSRLAARFSQFGPDHKSSGAALAVHT
jgi:hypothetical protein